ncbi:MAG: hypothetical protein OEZ59_02085 [Deltaproteobacteria bacterium]|nr:hypothetical protein [Deltaproteobacteria bacterium]
MGEAENIVKQNVVKLTNRGKKGQDWQAGERQKRWSWRQETMGKTTAGPHAEQQMGK